VKRDRVLAFAPDGLVLTSPEVVSWYLDGVRTTVPFSGASVLAVLVHPDGDQLRCYVNEHSRLVDEWGVDAEPTAWDAPLTAGWDAPGEAQFESQLRAARASLLPAELDRYRLLAREVAAAVTTVASGLRPRDTELAVAAQLAASVVAIGAEPAVVLVAGSSRLGYRHPLPTGAELGTRAMLVVGARRNGMVVSLTRWVSFAPSAVDDRIALVEADVLDATRVGRTVGAIFDDLRSAYRRHGYDPDEWRNHHQGGATGYLGRDPRAVSGLADVVQNNHAFAWNPSAPGAKAEDTVIATATGVELLTVDPTWPTTIIGGRARPLPLTP
jgi:Xaa-Pro aminopeptidase